MDNKFFSILLYDSLKENNVNNKIKIITDLFKIDRSTFFMWKKKFENIENNIFYDFDSINITQTIVNQVVSYVVGSNSINIKKIKKFLNKNIEGNNISSKQINAIIKNNESIIDINKKRTGYKLTNDIDNFIIISIKNNNTLTAKDIVLLIKNKFKVNISLSTIYYTFKKYNYTYKKTTVNINPHSFSDQKNQLTNVLHHLENNNVINEESNKECTENIDLINKYVEDDIDIINNLNNNLIENIDNEINKLNNNLNTTIKLINNSLHELISIDEFSIITNRTSLNGWSLKGTDCIINLPYVSPNKRYSLLMATSDKQILKYKLIEGSIKTDNFIKFMDELNKTNNNYSYLIDNASIHSNKKTKEFFKLNKMNVIYNAPYQSKFNPIEMVFSLLRKELNKKVVKNKTEIDNCVNEFIKNIKKETLKNIFNHSTKILKSYLNSNSQNT